jgi:L-alanine-DL-glutamate epimerase-like enolase superfamily enzyme
VLAGVPEPAAVVTAFTLSLAAPTEMAEAARRNVSRPLLKLKVGGEADLECVKAVRAAAPAARIIVDANEAWTASQVSTLPPMLAALGVELIEQPLPAGRDHVLEQVPHPLPVCADESCRDRASVPALAGRYDMVNVKLDKAGGLTEAIEVVRAARAAGLGVMVGCMVSTSLAMAPALLLAGLADVVDLDGPLLLARDRDPGLRYEGSVVRPALPGLWGWP